MLLIALVCAAAATALGLALAAGVTPSSLRAGHTVLGVIALVLVLLLTVPDTQWRLRGLTAGALLLATASGSKLFHRRIKRQDTAAWARHAHMALGVLGLLGLCLLLQA